MTLSIMTLGIDDTWQKITSHYAGCGIFYCYTECRQAECHYAVCHIFYRYAECRQAECRYAECHYAKCLTSFEDKTFYSLFNWFFD